MQMKGKSLPSGTDCDTYCPVNPKRINSTLWWRKSLKSKNVECFLKRKNTHSFGKLRWGKLMNFFSEKKAFWQALTFVRISNPGCNLCWHFAHGPSGSAWLGVNFSFAADLVKQCLGKPYPGTPQSLWFSSHPGPCQESLMQLHLALLWSKGLQLSWAQHPTMPPAPAPAVSFFP